MQATAVLSPHSTRTVAYSRLGDETLASRAAAGNTAAFSALYERYYGPLLGYCRSILLDAEDARDATQNALENALRALPRRETDRPVKPWLYRIAHNEAINIVRRRRPQAQLDDSNVIAVPGPEADCETRSRLSQLVSDLRELPERQRGALVMRELSGLSYDEIASALGVSNEAARRAVFDARVSLHDAVDGRATECVSVRHKLSDGDRRSLRARAIRAHLRSCDDCASFQRAITVRRGDLHLIGWLPGATGLSVVGAVGAGGGAGGAGGGALLVAGGSSAVAGGGIGWAALPVAVKSLAVAAAVATTGGAAAVELRQITKDSAPVPTVQVEQERRAAPALASPHIVVSSVASLKAAAPSPRRIRALAHASSNAHVSVSATTRNNAAVLTTTQRSANTPATTQTQTPAPAAPHAAAPTSKATPVAAATPAKTAVQTAIDKLTAYQAQIRAAYQQALATAAAGGTSAIQTASTTLTQTLDGIRPLIERVLASVGLKLPATATAPAPAPASQPTLSNVLQPVQQVLGSVSSLLQKLFVRQP